MRTSLGMKFVLSPISLETLVHGAWKLSNVIYPVNFAHGFRYFFKRIQM